VQQDIHKNGSSLEAQLPWSGHLVSRLPTTVATLCIIIIIIIIIIIRPSDRYLRRKASRCRTLCFYLNSAVIGREDDAHHMHTRRSIVAAALLFHQDRSPRVNFKGGQNCESLPQYRNHSQTEQYNRNLGEKTRQDYEG